MKLQTSLQLQLGQDQHEFHYTQPRNTLTASHLMIITQLKSLEYLLPRFSNMFTISSSSRLLGRYRRLHVIQLLLRNGTLQTCWSSYTLQWGVQWLLFHNTDLALRFLITLNFGRCPILVEVVLRRSFVAGVPSSRSILAVLLQYLVAVEIGHSGVRCDCGRSCRDCGGLGGRVSVTGITWFCTDQHPEYVFHEALLLGQFFQTPNGQVALPPPNFDCDLLVQSVDVLLLELDFLGDWIFVAQELSRLDLSMQKLLPAELSLPEVLPESHSGVGVGFTLSRLGFDSGFLSGRLLGSSIDVSYHRPVVSK